jgi:hypothetical protein
MVALLAHQCSVRKCLLSGTDRSRRILPEQLHTFFNHTFATLLRPAAANLRASSPPKSSRAPRRQLC